MTSGPLAPFTTAPAATADPSRRTGQAVGNHVSAPAVATISALQTVSVHEMRIELRRLQPHRVAGADGVYPRLMKDHSAQATEPFWGVLKLGRAAVLWKTSCLVLVPKVRWSAGLNDSRLVASNHT